MPQLRFIIITALMFATASTASADQETDRLRDALRSATAQSRQLADQNAALQARLTSAEQERDRLRKQSDAYRAQVKEAEQAYRQAVKDFNERIAARDDTLEKWKSAYNEAATVARAKEADRAKFEIEAKDLKTHGKSCEAKNKELVKVGQSIVTQYEAMNPFEKILDHDPVLGLKRVEHQNAAQDFRDKILEQKVTP
jgi:chromosome segregation ATPase